MRAERSPPEARPAAFTAASTGRMVARVKIQASTRATARAAPPLASPYFTSWRSVPWRRSVPARVTMSDQSQGSKRLT
jgi:hypothetical protein